MDRQGIDAKFGRARRLVDELHGEMTDFWGREPFQLEARDDAGDLVYVVSIREEPPTDWSVLIGDAVHNARSALDYVAGALVVDNGGTPDESTYFPITDQQTGYGDRLRKGLGGASQVSKNAVRALSPWRGGDDELWRLHRLDIIDKHRLLVAVGTAHRGITMSVTFPGFEPGDAAISSPPIALRSADRQFPLADGAEVFRIAAAAREENASGFITEHGVTFDLAFGDGEGVVVAGEPIFPTLKDLVEHAAAVADRLVPATA
jgi:hypothetical protein